MRERRHTKSGLFLIELMISLLFFVITAAVFLQVFARSRAVSKDAENLYQAQKLAASAAEILEGSTAFTKDLEKYFSESFADNAGEKNCRKAGYDARWEPVEKEEWEKAEFFLTVSWEEQDSMMEILITVIRKPEEEIYRLPLQIYQPE